jgi:hypothetical protein
VTILATLNYEHLKISIIDVPEVPDVQKALGKLPEDGNVMPKHVGVTIHN